MIIKTLFGNNRSTYYIILVILLSVLNLSCTSTKFKRDNNFFNGDEYYNTELNISSKFFGDISYSKPRRNEIKKKISEFKILKYKNLVVYGKSFISPFYDLLLFYENNVKSEVSNGIIEEVLLLNDTIKNRILYKKQDNNKIFYLLLIGERKKWTKNFLLDDAKKIIKNTSFDTTIINKFDYVKLFNNYRQEDNILLVREKFDNAPISNNNKNNWMKFQLLSPILSRDSENRRFVESIEEFESKRLFELSRIYKDSMGKIDNIINQSEDSVLREIKRLSRDQQVVMLNEIHWHPKHRIMAFKLLPLLKENGFKYIAIEAIDKNKDSELNKRKYPVKSSGYYTREPFFAMFIREALALGFIIKGYDDFESDNRELKQAKNIYNIIEKDKKAKVFVYAGIDHILENNPSKIRMAEYFRNISEIDPLTLDQVELISDTKEKINIVNSQVFKENLSINTNVDYFIINNINTTINEIYGEKHIRRHKIVLNKEVIKFKNQEIFISVYFNDEFEINGTSSIPILNRIILFQDDIYLSLKKGNYYIIVKDKENHIVQSNKLIVE